MPSAFATASYREIIDANGRAYRVGETDRNLLGRSRSWMAWLPWIAMMAVSNFEYGYGALHLVVKAPRGRRLRCVRRHGCRVATGR
jgi:hypothetical protein